MNNGKDTVLIDAARQLRDAAKSLLDAAKAGDQAAKAMQVDTARTLIGLAMRRIER